MAMWTWTWCAVAAAALAAAAAVLWGAGAGADAAVFYRGRSVWVTGASSGIGEALAAELARSGARVVVSARRPCAAALRAGAAAYVPLDLSRADGSVAAAAAAAEAEAGGAFDVVFHNAGRSVRGSVADTEVAVHRELMQVNHLGAVEATRALLPGLRRRGGRLCFVGSVQSKLGVKNRSAYAAAKHAVVGYADSLRAEEAGAVGVTVALPGYVRTSLSENAASADGSAYAKTDAATAAGADARETALQIMRAVAAGRNEVVLASLTSRAAVALRGLVPDLIFTLVRRRQ